MFELHRFLVSCGLRWFRRPEFVRRGTYLIFGTVLSMVAKAYPTVISHDLARTGWRAAVPKKQETP
jgi:hypothetical protein